MSDIDRIEKGDPSAANQLLPLVYGELHKLAVQRLAHERHLPMEASALVHEAYIRVVKNNQGKQWDSRGHYFAAAAEAMRRILIDEARNSGRLKRGGDRTKLDFDTIEFSIGTPVDTMLIVDDLLEQLEQSHPECAQLVKLRCFGGLTLSEAADSLGLAHRTADRYWAVARQWLTRSIHGATSEE